MAMEETGKGDLVLTVERIHGGPIKEAHVGSYRISAMGLHYEDVVRHFIPHANIAKMSVWENDGGGWK
jgi:hypothetical protein